MKTYELTDIKQAVDVGTTLKRSWFRGHATACGALTPRLFRPDFDDQIVRDFRPALEIELIEEFKRTAPALIDRVPDADDMFGWIYLMQHFGTPTRLLDWTENVLVALWFAVATDQNVDGEVWAMYPLALNRESHVGPHLPIVGRNPVLGYLIDEPYWAGRPDELAAKWQIDVVPDRPVAFRPQHTFRRLVAQWGTFTIHPRPAPNSSITDLLTAPSELVRYIVPAEHKPELEDCLIAIGIDDGTVFPDLGGLSRRLVRETEVIAYSPPAPPVCGGERMEK